MLPEIIWLAPNNMLESTMTVFILLAAYAYLKALFVGDFPIPWVILAGFGVILSFLTKGPIGLFPLGIPLIHHLVYRKHNLTKILKYTFIPLLIVTFGLTLILLNPLAYKLVSTFLDQQMLSGINGERELAEQTFGRFSILWYLFNGLLPLIGIWIITILINYFNKGKVLVDNSNKKLSLFLFLIGIIGSIPIIVSRKQSAFYLVPSLPFYALAFATMIVPSINFYFKRYSLSPSKVKIINSILSSFIVILLIYTYNIAGQPGREHQLQEELKIVSEVIPHQLKLGVCPEMKKNAYLHGYLQRYYRIELTTNLEDVNYFMLGNLCKSDLDLTLKNNGFFFCEIPKLKTFKVFVKE
jgi:4-amino-4-deoxy-L-arabinose transferase-like glycosyltransferase